MGHRTLRVAVVIGISTALVVGGTALGLAVSNAPPASASTSGSASCGGSTPKLTVQGSGQASAPPDVLTVTVDIEVTDPSAQASLVDDNTKASSVTSVLEQGGVPSKDIQTSNVSIEPQTNLAGLVTGYEMTNTLTAQLRDFSTAGALLDRLTAAAGNATRIDSLTFSIQDPRKIEDTARTDAVHQAVSHARSMAEAAGERLGPVCSLTDDSSPDDVGPTPYGIANSAEPSAAAAVPLAPGTQQETAQITLVYALVGPSTRA